MGESHSPISAYRLTPTRFGRCERNAAQAEGELGVVATNFADYLWLLAGGVGAYEAVAYPEADGEENPVFTAFARKYAGIPQSKPSEIISKARSLFPTFVADLQSLCGYG